MKIVIVGASGYLGSELLHQAKASGYEALGTYHTCSRPELVRFELEDESTWDAIIEQRPDVVIWAAWVERIEHPDKSLKKLLNNLQSAKFVYISSDIVLCERALAADSSLGDYARCKRDEQEAVLGDTEAAVFTVGPIYGESSDGMIDKRTKPLLDEPDKQRQYWDNVYKTFVPIKGLARTVLANLDKRGQYFIGPQEQMSYFEFYRSRAQAHHLPISNLRPTKVTDRELSTLNQCKDLSYGYHPKRLWEEA